MIKLLKETIIGPSDHPQTHQAWVKANDEGRETLLKKIYEVANKRSKL